MFDDFANPPKGKGKDGVVSAQLTEAQEKVPAVAGRRW